MEGNTLQWEIVEKNQETPTVTTFTLRAKNEKPDFIAGQYLTILLEGHDPVEGKAYSIASAPYEDTLTLGIKEIGDFSKAILEHKIGDSLVTTKPYGFFYPEPEDVGPLVFVIGGIGITPCLSIMKQLAHDNDERQLIVHYSNQTLSEIAFKDQLESLPSQRSDSFFQTHYITRDEVEAKDIKNGRMDGEQIVSGLSEEDRANAMFFICGSMHFTKDMWNDLREQGIAPEQLYTEGFF